MTKHSDHRWDLCPDCGVRQKIETAARCQVCHTRVYLPRRRRLRKRARGLVADWLDGCVIYLGPGEGMSRREFVGALRDVVNST